MIIGIDPGLKGGIAWRTDTGYGAAKMPTTTKGVMTLIASLPDEHDKIIACLEQVQVMGKVFGAKAALSYGQKYGELIGILTVLGATIHEVRPSVWKRTLNISSDKNTAILLCERLFPNLDLSPGQCRKPQDGLAESMLLVHYAEKMGLK
jgi:hypothetical protein